MTRELVVMALELDGGSGSVTLVLAPVGEGAPQLVLPVVIGPVEAAAIASARMGARPARPLTHDLALALLAACDERVAGVEITALDDGVFHAEVMLSGGARVDARTSDAIALSLRAGVPVRCREEVFMAAAVPIPPALAEIAGEGEVERFREFLDQVDPGDFADS